ncbi:MAG: 2,3-bisphosphoglycerate-independent phosphoglycerate mutase [Candidatus Magasanikbacteria bacterium]|nr:2,3-bisphosphoglycerate-independent phosphoglycerate mutase [Candidatus Magasanikbacteria bacterium]
MSKSYKPVTLVICDGWGVAPDSDGNAIAQAKLPNFKSYIKEYPAMTLHASGNEVGLLFGEIGNSEVGHLNIGAGRVYYQSCPRINQEISSGEFFKNKAFLDAIAHVEKNKSKLHIIAMLSSGNVHASNEHLYALLDLCKKQGLGKEVFVHVILDGRDCIYSAGESFVKELEAKLKKLKVGAIASLSGRFYAMDRDNRWERVEAAYKAMAEGKAERSATSPAEAIKASYAKKNYDEEFVPTVIMDGDSASAKGSGPLRHSSSEASEAGKPVATVTDGDAIIFANFRPDRARELTKAFVLPGFDKFKRSDIKKLFFVTMMEYEKDLPVVVAYAPIVARNCLAEAVSLAGLKQFHAAETEKYAHVTFFLNGTIEEAFPGEERALVSSPHVASYAEVPAMSASEVTKKTIKAIDSGKFDLVVINYANADMVGHTGDRKATIAACETIDKCLGDIVGHTLAVGGVVIMTADHGNAEEVINLQTGEMDKEHSTNPVPLLVIGADFRGQAGPGGDAPEGDLSLLPPVGFLADVAPTVLKLMGLTQPKEMTGTPLI